MTNLVSSSIEQLKPYEAGKPIEELARELGVTDAVKLASNENPLGPSPRALEAVSAALSGLHRYPDAAAWELRSRLAARHGMSAAQVLQGNGSNELLELLVRTFVGPGEHVVFGEPSFVVYRLACLAHGVDFTAVPLRDYVFDIPAMIAAVTPQTKLLFIANPNNPTGTYVPRAALEQCLREVPPSVIVAIDEAYTEYADAPDFVSALELRGLRERLVVLRTFSKIYGLAALRVGYALGPADIIDYMNRVRAPFNVGTLGQVGALAALEDEAHVRASQELNQRERWRVGAALAGLGMTVVPSQANFIFVDIHRPSRPLYDALLLRGVIVRPVGGLPSCLRITLGLERENDRLLAALAEVLAT